MRSKLEAALEDPLDVELEADEVEVEVEVDFAFPPEEVVVVVTADPASLVELPPDADVTLSPPELAEDAEDEEEDPDPATNTPGEEVTVIWAAGIRSVERREMPIPPESCRLGCVRLTRAIAVG